MVDDQTPKGARVRPSRAWMAECSTPPVRDAMDAWMGEFRGIVGRDDSGQVASVRWDGYDHDTHHPAYRLDPA